ncbi:MAG: phosphatidate cytidylyltransferase [Actinomycetales bacterium]
MPVEIPAEVRIPAGAALPAFRSTADDEAPAVVVGPDGIPAPVQASAATGEPVIVVPRKSRAGRDLPAAIAVGVAMLVLVLVGLLVYPVAFVVIVTAFTVVGVWEVGRALQIRGITLPWLPVLMGSVALPASAYFSGAEGLLFAFVVTAAALLVYRCLDPAEGSAKSIFAGIFVLAWIPFLISFALVILRGSTGPTTGLTADVTAIGSGAMLVAVTLLLVVANDTFGYLLGAFFGKHPMAPKISPKKSWEGFAGSIGGAMIVAILCATLLLHLPWWAGIVLAVGLVTASTAGDLAESMVKRELGIKDMSSILPGHGGVMDRLDSILFAAPMAFILFSLLGALPA